MSDKVREDVDSGAGSGAGATAWQRGRRFGLIFVPANLGLRYLVARFAGDTVSLGQIFFSTVVGAAFVMLFIWAQHRRV